MGRYMVELGLTPAARSRVMEDTPMASPEPIRITRRIVDAETIEPEPQQQMTPEKRLETNRGN